jgi:anti-anti-sigma factor
MFDVTVTSGIECAHVVVRARGDVDILSAGDLRAALAVAALTDQGMVVDLTGVTFFSAAVVRCLEDADRSAHPQRSSLRLVWPPSHSVLTVLRAVRMFDRWRCPSDRCAGDTTDNCRTDGDGTAHRC